MKHRSRHSLTKKRAFDPWLGFSALLFSMFGILMIYEASNVTAFRDFGDKNYFIKEQLFAVVVGVCALISASFVSYKRYYNFSIPLLLISIISLLAVFIPGIGVRTLGANRWIDLGIFNYQPSEITKLAMIVYLSSWLSHPEKKRLLPFVLLLLFIVGLVILQPDLGTAIILASLFLSLYYLSGAPVLHIALLVPLFALAGIGLAATAPYRFARLTAFFNPAADPLGSSYHIRQILLSLGSGGFWGVGFGASRQKYQYLPEAETDSIFAIIGEELGFFGAVLFLAASIFFLYRIFLVARYAPDRQSLLLAGGIFALFAFQFCVNLGAMVALIPLTGVPLPFISYGGSNLLVSFIAVGILLNISKHVRR